MSYTNYTITKIDRKFWAEFMTACRHYDLSARAMFIRHAQNIVNDYRIDKGKFEFPEPAENGGKKK